MIQVGAPLPAGTLYEFIETETAGCSLGPNALAVEQQSAGKKILIFGLPGAFTPTCSAQHAPGYLRLWDAFKTKGVEEIWCLSVNDAFVMNAWSKMLGAGGKLRMMADGSGAYTRSLGLELDLSARGMGIRCQRFAMVVDSGTVTTLNVEAPGKFEVSSAEAMLALI